MTSSLCDIFVQIKTYIHLDCVDILNNKIRSQIKIIQAIVMVTDIMGHPVCALLHYVKPCEPMDPN